MRITDGMMAASALRNVNSAQQKLATANEAVSSNEKIQLASDNPTVATRAVIYRNYVSQIKTYQDSVDSAEGWQSATDSALTDLAKQITSLKTIATKADDTCDTDTLKTTAENALTDILDTMNCDYCGSYIFGGYSTGEEPYKLVSTAVGDVVTFKGQVLSLGGVIQSSATTDEITEYMRTNSSNAYNSVASAAASALSLYNTAQTSADAAGNTDATLNARALAAKAASDTLAEAATAYDGTTNLQDAIGAVSADIATLNTELDKYSTSTSTTTLATAAAEALAEYNASAADSTALAATTASLKTTSDALTALVSKYGAATTLSDASLKAANISDVLQSALDGSGQSINYDIGFSSQTTVNVEGQDVSGQGTDNLFNTISKLLLALNGDTTYKSAAIDSSTSPATVNITTHSLDVSDLIDEFEDDLERMEVPQATLGSRLASVKSQSSQLDTAYELYKGLMTDNENVDTATAASDLESANYCYEATLQVAAKTTQKSLIDYIT